jgi:hypothetical protein
MKTSTEYTKNLKNKIITSDMLYDSIFSLNKRAKNNRDMKNQYSWSRYYWSYVTKMNEYYRQKDFLIKKFLKPKLIHKQKTEGWYGETKYLYFIYYEMPQGSFHTPVKQEDIKKDYSHLKIENIPDDFYTHGKEIQELMSVQFVNKLIRLVESDDFEYIEMEVKE